MDVYQFKIANGGRWEDTPVFTTIHNLTHSQAKENAKEFAAYFGAACRFNVRGSLQGHYVASQQLVAMGGQ